MKRILSLSLTLIMLIMSCFLIVSCVDRDGGGQGEMLYTKDTTLGNGDTTFTLIVEHTNNRTVTFTINTSKEILSDALTEVGILEGHDSTYGLYIDAVNGVTHDFTVDQTYWAIYVGDEYAPVGIDFLEIESGATYKLVASK